MSVYLKLVRCCSVVVLWCWGHWLELPLLTLNCCVMFGVAGLPCPWLLPRCTELSRCTLYTTTGEVRTLNLSTERDSGKLGFYVGLNTKTIRNTCDYHNHQTSSLFCSVFCTLYFTRCSSTAFPISSQILWGYSSFRVNNTCFLLVELKTWVDQQLY